MNTDLGVKLVMSLNPIRSEFKMFLLLEGKDEAEIGV